MSKTTQTNLDLSSRNRLEPRAQSAPKLSRKQRLIAALSCAEPVAVPALCEQFKLQPHSLHVAICGLRKAGHAIETIPSPTGGAARYQIIAAIAQIPEPSVGQVSA